MDSDSFEKNLVEKLKSNNLNEVLNALSEIKNKYAKNKTMMKELTKYSLIKILIPYMEHPKFCNPSLSILADGCLHFNFVNEVIKYDGIKSLMRIMKSGVNDGIQNRACRALGNIAKFETGFKAVHKMKPVPDIVNLLIETNNEICQQNAVRTLMILCRSSKTRKLIEQENGICQIAKLLHSSNIDVLNCSIKALTNLTRNCSLNIALELSQLQFQKVIVNLNYHPEKTIRCNALLLLNNLSVQEEIRAGFVKEGAVKLLTEIITHSESYEMNRLAALMLCNFMDHIHMWSHNGTERVVGFKALLAILQNEKFQDIHLPVISCLVSVSHSSKNMDILLNIGLLKTFIQILSIFIKKNNCKFLSNCILSNENYAMIDITNYNDESYTSKVPVIYHSFFCCETNCVIQQEISSSHVKNVGTTSFCDESTDSLPMHFCNFGSTGNHSDSCTSIKSQALPDAKYEVNIDSPSTSYACNSVYSLSSKDECGSSNYNQFKTDSSSLASVNLNLTNPKCDALDEDVCTQKINEVQCTGGEYNLPRPSSGIKHSLEDFNMSSIMGNLSVSEKSNLVSRNILEGHVEKNVLIKSIDETFDSRKRFKREKSNKDNHSNNKSSTETSTNEVTKATLHKIKHINQLPWGAFNCSVENFIGNQTRAKKLKTNDYHVLKFILLATRNQEKKPNSPLADKSCFSVIMDYVCFTHCPEPEAKYILYQFIDNRYWFEKLVANGFFTEIEEKYACINNECILRVNGKAFYEMLFRKSRIVAESDFGIGSLSHVLIISDKIGQCHAFGAALKLFTTKYAFHRLFYQHKGLQILFNLLLDNCNSYRMKATIYLCELYQFLLKDHKVENCCCNGSCQLKDSSKCFYENCVLDVKFYVNDGRVIHANRNKLCQNSEYFNALLNGHFAETNADDISLSDMSYENLKMLFHFLHCCKTSYCHHVKHIHFRVLLELLPICDRFLLTDIKEYVEDKLCHSLSPLNVFQVYEQSKINNSPALCKKAVGYALSLNTQLKDAIFNVFEEFFDSESNFNFLNDVENILNDLF